MNTNLCGARQWALALLMGLLLLPYPVQAQADTSNSPETIQSDFVPGEIIVALHPQTDEPVNATTEGVVAAASGTLTVGTQQFTVLEPLDMRRAPTVELSEPALNPTGGVVRAAEADNRAPNGWLVQVKPGAELATIDLLNGDPAVAFAEPNWIVRAAEGVAQEVPTNGTVPPPDASLISIMPLASTETPFFVSDPFYAEEQWDMQRINASRAWQLLERISAEQSVDDDDALDDEAIRIAVVDSGIDAFHGDLYQRVLEGKNYLDPADEPIDDYGHGTHVAGLAGATLNNGIGIAGVANDVLLDPRKVLDGNGAGRISNLAQAIRDAADEGANIINLSLETGEESQTLSRAVEYAADQGVLLIAASGNGGRDVKWPAVHPDVMAVAALDYFDQRAYYSNYGDEIEIAAPGRHL